MSIAIRRVAIGCSVSFMVAVIGAIILWRTTDWDDICPDEVISTVKSPDGKLKAVVFERDCGATTDFSTQVSLLPSDGEVHGKGNIFIADSNHGIAPTGADNGLNVTVKWQAPNQLQITYDGRVRTFKMQHHHDTVSIAYLAILVTIQVICCGAGVVRPQDVV